MIKRIQSDSKLKKILVDECCENDYSVNFSEKINRNEDVAILKVDAYYNTKDFAKPPKSIDCLVVLRCKDGSFSLYLVELRNIRRMKHLKVSQIDTKFKTTVNDFMAKRFLEIFMDEQLNIKDIKAYFVTDPRGAGKGVDQEIFDRKYKGTRLDASLARPLLRFRGRVFRVEHVAPDLLLEAC